jgi:hypothetical protein
MLFVAPLIAGAALLVGQHPHGWEVASIQCIGDMQGYGEQYSVVGQTLWFPLGFSCEWDARGDGVSAVTTIHGEWLATIVFYLAVLTVLVSIVIAVVGAYGFSRRFDNEPWATGN